MVNWNSRCLRKLYKFIVQMNFYFMPFVIIKKSVIEKTII